VNKALTPGVVITVVAVLCGAAYIATPALQSDQVQVDQEVQRHVEQARRLLDQVGANEERLGTVLEGLRAAGVQDPDDQALTTLVEENRDLLNDAQQRLRDIDRQRDSVNQQVMTAGGVPAAQMAPALPGNAAQMVDAIRDGLAARERLINENASLLEQAAKAVGEALAVQHGDASGRDNPAALNLQGVILYEQAAALHRQARPLRDAAQGPRTKLLLAAAELTQRTAGQNVVADSKVDARIEEATQQEKSHADALAALNEQIKTLADQVAGLETALAEQQKIADETRLVLDGLVDQGANLADADGVGKFAKEYSAKSLIYREALRRAQVLEFGTLNHATLAPGGDYLTGAYAPKDDAEPIAPERGLFHLRAELTDLRAQAEAAGTALADLRTDIDGLRAEKTRLAGEAAAAESRAAQLRTEAAEVFKARNELLVKAEGSEDAAIAKLTSAVGAFRSAGQRISALQREAGDALTGVSPEARERSAKALYSDDRWSPASADARRADAQFRLAMIHYERYRDLAADAKTLSNLAGALNLEVDTAALAERAETARTQGLEAADEAANTLFSASGGLNQHFAVTAEIAAVYYLQSLLGDETKLAAAIANYEAAVEGREDSPLVQQFAERLEQLRRSPTP